MSIKTRSKAHTRYYDRNDTLVVGVSTIVGLEDKPFLVNWANKLGLEGVDSKLYTHHTARVGTLAHLMVESDLTGERLDTSDYSENEIAEARLPYNKFKNWINEQKDFEVIFTEKALVSEGYKYGGTCDIYAKVNGRRTLIDLKTSPSIYDSHKTQLAAYKYLLMENDYEVEDARILRIGRGKQGGFEDVRVSAIMERFQKFLILLELYNKNKEIKKSE